jgi:hypothetical protein
LELLALLYSTSSPCECDFIEFHWELYHELQIHCGVDLTRDRHTSLEGAHPLPDQARKPRGYIVEHVRVQKPMNRERYACRVRAWSKKGFRSIYEGRRTNGRRSCLCNLQTPCGKTQHHYDARSQRKTIGHQQSGHLLEVESPVHGRDFEFFRC